MQSVIGKHEELFRPGLHKLKGHKVRILVDPDAKPRFCKARTIPYAFKAKVEEELERLIPWNPYSDKSSVRICGDFRLISSNSQEVYVYVWVLGRFIHIG